MTSKMAHLDTDILIIGAGILGLSTAYALKKQRPDARVILVDRGNPMAFTSAQSGENYRNWWPHPVMTAFTDHSISLMETIARDTDNRINLTRGGYALATRRPDMESLIQELKSGYAQSDFGDIRVHGSKSSDYSPPFSDEWSQCPTGVDVLTDPDSIKTHFPNFDNAIRGVIHIRRAGSIDSQQLGQFMLESFHSVGGQFINGEVVGIDQGNEFRVEFKGDTPDIKCTRLINAAGPFINQIAEMLGTQLPVENSLQQKIAFEDVLGAIPRDQPFSIDLDRQLLDWSEEDRALLREDPELSWLADEMQGAIHCRPDGGRNGKWVKLGWAFGQTVTSPVMQPACTDFFPEVVLRGAARLNPALKQYYGRLPSSMSHYCGYYTETAENWPIIGKMTVENAYVVGALSGYGTMAACAAGELCANWVLDRPHPAFSHGLSLERYDDRELMAEIESLSSRGTL